MSKKDLEQELQIYNEILNVILKASQRHRFGNILKVKKNWINFPSENYQTFSKECDKLRKNDYRAHFYLAENRRTHFYFEGPNIIIFGEIKKGKVIQIQTDYDKNNLNPKLLLIDWRLLWKEKRELENALLKKIS